MKKLSYFLIPLISLLFIVNVKADSNVVTSMLQPMQKYINNHSGSTQQDYIDYLLSFNDILQKDTNYSYYTIIFNGTWLFYFKFNNPIHIATDDSSGHAIWLNTISNSDIYGYEQYEIVSNSRGEITNFRLADQSNNARGPISALGYSGYVYYYILATNQENYVYTTPTWSQTPFSVDNNTWSFGDNVPINFTNGNTYNFEVTNIFQSEPTYSYEETILENGNVKLDFTFTNYNENSGYAFEIENGVSNEEYGITNTYSNIFPNQIPFGNTYSIEIPYDTILYVTLAKYEQVEETTLYYRTEIYTQMIDINNIVFENPNDPYFVIYRQSQNLIEGSFANTTSNNTCWYKYSTSQTEDFVPCDEMLGLSVYDNGYVEVIIKKGNQIVYSRKINYIGNTTNDPYIVYEINKQDFYSVVNWHIENEYSNMTYRYSTDNGNNFTSWINYNNNSNLTINAFDNTTIIIEIANNDQTTIYDSKAIVVVNNISTIKNINSTTGNFLNKFKSIFNINSNILNNINNYYEKIKLSKLYLIIFIPFIVSIIASIIYLIRRK